jgi:hypothetical protein
MSGKQEKKQIVGCVEWPLGLIYGDLVRVKGRLGKVVDAPLKDVPKCHVPISYNGRPFVCVIADDIDLGPS